MERKQKPPEAPYGGIRTAVQLHVFNSINNRIKQRGIIVLLPATAICQIQEHASLGDVYACEDTLPSTNWCDKNTTCSSILAWIFENILPLVAARSVEARRPCSRPTCACDAHGERLREIGRPSSIGGLIERIALREDGWRCGARTKTRVP